ncbi:ribokinase [Acetobacter sp. DsW_063]|uniref:ribokinase n=1 Tax=Acetobacter sp. DsW_063 TaxID=1514894 RepID=UPI000A3A5079|nr:ribokinase [Acetobacter sp. DsW_063]OUJ16554.1 ribokinase [Acetobacter sp. DsW_063]
MTATKPLVLSFGSVNIDVTAKMARLPRPGETVLADGYAIGLGGKGGNQAAAAGRLAQALGLRAALAGRIGNDAFGQQARRELERFGVDLSALREDEGAPTGVALIGVDHNGENAISVAGGANMRIDASDIDHAAALFDAAAVLLLQLEIPMDAVVAAAERVRRTGGLVVLDPAPAPARALPECLWTLIDVVTPNETETQVLTGVAPDSPESAQLAARTLLERGARAAIVKMGARGVWWQDENAGGFISAFPVVAIDSVAAGDCFNAGLAVSLAQGRALADAVQVAAACGALATTRSGAADAAPTWGEVEDLLSRS